MKNRFIYIAGMLLGMMGSAFATDPFQAVLSQYTAAWDVQSGYKIQGPIWDPGASFTLAFQLVPPAVRSYATSSNTLAQYNFYTTNFQGKLRAWAQTAQAQDLTDEALIEGTRNFLDSMFAQYKSAIAALYPGYPDDVYRGLIIQNLVHATYSYGTSWYYETITNQVPGQTNVPILVTGQLTVAQELKSLLQLTTADCGEISEFTRVLGHTWGLDVRYVGIQPDYWSSIANQRVTAGVHAINILLYTNAAGVENALLIDSLTNTAIAAGPLAGLLPDEMVGDGIIASSSTAGGRYMALANSGKLLTFFNYYMHPPVREGYLKSSSPDASVLKFMYAYFLEAYPNPKVTYLNSPAWQVNNASYSTNQPLY